MRRTTMGLVGLVLAAVTLAGCGGEDEPAATDPTTAAPSSAEPSSAASSSPESSTAEPVGTVVDITFDGDTVQPNGERIDAKVGEPITLNVTADVPGEIHVHSTPEQELEYAAGQTTLELTIDQPGVVEVESHSLELTIIQLEVR